LSADTTSIVQTHTLFITQIDQRRQNRTFCNVVGVDGITGLQIRFANALKAEPQCYRHTPNTIVS